jgi:hypothetical protein
MEGGAVGHNFERDSPCQVWFNLVQQFQRRRFKLMSFLAYITGYFMNFEILSILTDYAN